MSPKRKVGKSKVKGSKKARVKLPSLRDPRTGLFIKRTVAAVRKVAKEIGRAYRKAAAERNKWARARHRGAKRTETLTKYTQKYQRAMRRAASLAPKLARAQQQVSLVEAQSSQVRLPRVMEVGVDYSAARGAGHDVNFNIRVARVDGRGVSEADAKRAVTAIAEGEKSLPSDLRITAVEWGRPSRQRSGGIAMKRGSSEDVWSFADILAEVVINRKGDGLRIGHVKDDEL